jgi:hypothetical protein
MRWCGLMMPAFATRGAAVCRDAHRGRDPAEPPAAELDCGWRVAPAPRSFRPSTDRRSVCDQSREVSGRRPRRRVLGSDA